MYTWKEQTLCRCRVACRLFSVLPKRHLGSFFSSVLFVSFSSVRLSVSLRFANRVCFVLSSLFFFCFFPFFLFVFSFRWACAISKRAITNQKAAVVVPTGEVVLMVLAWPPSLHPHPTQHSNTHASPSLSTSLYRCHVYRIHRETQIRIRRCMNTFAFPPPPSVLGVRVSLRVFLWV